MELFTRIEAIRPWVARRDWAGLERTFEDACRADAPGEEAGISRVDLRRYTGALVNLVGRASKALGPDIAAVYWEFDVDNDWSSAAFLCSRYEPETATDDDWASEFDAERAIHGPAMPELARLMSTWTGNEHAAANAYLIARTIAAFGRASAGWHADRPLCAGYHDQSVVFRIVAGAGDIPAR